LVSGTAASNNGMHLTRDTAVVMCTQRCWRAGDAGRYAALVVRIYNGLKGEIYVLSEVWRAER
jgi:hypothetical protein